MALLKIHIRPLQKIIFFSRNRANLYDRGNLHRLPIYPRALHFEIGNAPKINVIIVVGRGR
jgi:hypothetical protein